MQTVANVLGTVSGLRFVAPNLEPNVMAVTAVAMHITYAILCRIFAAQRGRAPLAWLIAGFVTGIAAVMALLVLGDRKPADT